MSHSGRAPIDARYPLFVTLRRAGGLPGLRCDDAHAIVRATLAAASAAETIPGFRVVEYSLQSDHLHLLVEGRGRTELQRGMKGLAVRLARALNRLWRRRGQVWGDRYDARPLEDPHAVRAGLVRVLQDARRHGAWRARGPDPYSSAPEFDGWKGREPARERVLAEPRTALLAREWRRLGRLDAARFDAAEMPPAPLTSRSARARASAPGAPPLRRARP